MSIKTGVRYKVVAFEMSVSMAVVRFGKSDKRESCSKIQLQVNQYRVRGNKMGRIEYGLSIVKAELL